MYNRVQPKPSTKEWRPWNSFLNKNLQTTIPEQRSSPDREPYHPDSLAESVTEIKLDRSLMASKWALKPDVSEPIITNDMDYVSLEAVEPKSPEPNNTYYNDYVSLKALGIYFNNNERMKEHTNSDSSNDSVEKYQILRYSRDEIMKIDLTVNTSWTCNKTIDIVNNKLLAANVFLISPKRVPKGPVYSTNFMDRRERKMKSFEKILKQKSEEPLEETDEDL